MTTKKGSRKQTRSTEKRPAKRKRTGEPSVPAASDVGAGSRKSAKAGQPAKERKPSALGAAAQVLAEAHRPLSAGEIVKRMLERSLWQTKGKTPQATLYSALLRHIQKHGAASPLRKVGRGRFELVK